jgi:hypothetical protein
MTMITELGATLDGDSRGPSPELRTAVLRQFQPAARPRLRPHARRPVRRIGLAAGTVAAATAGALAASALGLWGGTPAASAAAVALLGHAATTAASARTVTPGAKQYVYVKTVETAAELNGDGSSVVHELTNTREIWQSADGSKAGLLKELSAAPGSSWQSIPLPPERGYPAGLPTTTAAMLTYLYHNSHGENPPDVQAFITAGDLIRESYVQPAALAAVFRAVAKIPGVTVTQHAANANGQDGVAVQQIFHGISAQLIFNPKTYAFIGERQVVVGTGAGLRIGTLLDSTAILATGVVDQAGQLPG